LLHFCSCWNPQWCIFSKYSFSSPLLKHAHLVLISYLCCLCLMSLHGSIRPLKALAHRRTQQRMPGYRKSGTIYRWFGLMIGYTVNSEDVTTDIVTMTVSLGLENWD
jgi:hypothetical protein